MRKMIVMACVAMCASWVMTSCGGSKQVVQQAPKSGGNPFANTFEMPAAEYDTDEYFGATGVAEGAKSRMDVLQTAALTNAQNLVRQKMKHAYKGMINNYSDYMGNDTGADAKTHVESAGTQIIDAIINDTQARQVRFSEVDEKGNVTCFVGIRVYKKAVADKISEHISKDEELKIRFNEQEFRKKMEEAFKKYEEGQQH